MEGKKRRREREEKKGKKRESMLRQRLKSKSLRIFQYSHTSDITSARKGNITFPEPSQTGW